MVRINFKNNWGSFRATYDSDSNLVELKKIKNSSAIREEHKLGSILDAFYEQKSYCLPEIKLIGTDFQKKVWSTIARIPHGKTMTYQEIANTINHPKAVRAVGTACKTNPIPFLIPCHRVVSKNNGIGNYFYGIGLKKLLLQKEGSLGR